MERNAHRAPLTALALALLLAAAGCGSSEKGAATSKAAAEPPPVPVNAAEAVQTMVAEGIPVTGTLRARFEAQVKAEFTGRVSELFVTDWTAVRKGQPLVRIDDEEARLALRSLEAQAQAAEAGLAEARSAQAQADRERDRVARLVASGLATSQDQDNARSASEAAAARVQSAQAALLALTEQLTQSRTHLTKSVLLSPIAGTVSDRKVNVGDLVGPGGDPIFTIVDNRSLDLVVSVPSRDMARVRPGQRLTFSADAWPGRAFEGRVTHLNPSVNPADRSLAVTSVVDNPSGELKSGLYVSGRIEVAEPRPALTVPRTALVGYRSGDGTARLFVVDGGTARQRAVTVLSVEGDSARIGSGLSAGERVVVRGAAYLSDGARIAVIAGEGA